ncbi:imidazole glycerol phosphate synthase [Candidatus Methylomirabilis lanthanidiphila]|uniref:Imidazole glycerol phosphate synthase subunit HisH n=1 Tax=Candidatus Methylomirabilis lanthanidiphila TaxID=2211376 RepID=A0A564ZFL2_9BACT|nr:imidazole glycerol phosphate synthase subunit HisH [Candidatus Methylomirabilis lanthanidiphila]VUZ84115.1 imidazole glycerol phosphate synthase [Candidatus Methylomirabilis lanthanidiphila]
MIAIVDSGIANLRSVQKGFERVDADAKVVDDPRTLRDAAGIVLPGVGAFADGISKLQDGGFVEPLLRAIEAGKPVLGICLGLHFLFSESEEFGHHAGLNIIKGRVVRFTDASLSENRHDGFRLKIPHMGWNRIRIDRPAPIFKGIPDGAFFYFVHSYYVQPEDDSVIAATTEHGLRFTSALWRDNLFACQFHPEKSQALGLQLLKNFASLT